MPTELRTTSTGSLESERPRDDEIDLFGLTHIGKVRKNNQDHFLLAMASEERAEGPRRANSRWRRS
jgi:hypothetical protein